MENTTHTDAVTTLLAAIREGDAHARDRLVELVYSELRRLAGGMMNHERRDHTLVPTALVHETLLRLFERDALLRLDNRRHFFSAAATAMRRVLVDHARAKATDKRGGHAQRVPLDELLAVFDDSRIDILALNNALDALAGVNPRQHQFVELHYFAGLAQQKIADLFELSHTTVEEELRKAKDWLRPRLRGDCG